MLHILDGNQLALVGIVPTAAATQQMEAFTPYSCIQLHVEFVEFRCMYDDLAYPSGPSEDLTASIGWRGVSLSELNGVILSELFGVSCPVADPVR